MTRVGVAGFDGLLVYSCSTCDLPCCPRSNCWWWARRSKASALLCFVFAFAVSATDSTRKKKEESEGKQISLTGHLLSLPAAARRQRQEGAPKSRASQHSTYINSPDVGGGSDR